MNIHKGFEILIDESFGGEVKEFIESVKGKEMLCMCKSRIFAVDFLAYTHEGGLADLNGSKWWVYVRCPYCEYDISFSKIKNRIEKLKREDEFNE